MGHHAVIFAAAAVLACQMTSRQCFVRNVQRWAGSFGSMPASCCFCVDIPGSIENRGSIQGRCYIPGLRRKFLYLGVNGDAVSGQVCRMRLNRFGRGGRNCCALVGSSPSSVFRPLAMQGISSCLEGHLVSPAFPWELEYIGPGRTGR